MGIANGFTDLVGNTPLVRLAKISEKEGRERQAVNNVDQDKPGYTLGDPESPQGPGHGEQDHLERDKTPDEEHEEDHFAPPKPPLGKDVAVNSAKGSGYEHRRDHHLYGVDEVALDALAIDPDTG